MSADYTHGNVLFNSKKVLRYTRLYGVSRTLWKIRGQYHMKAKRGFDGARWVNGACRTPSAAQRSIAIIGCGNYAFSTIAYYIKRNNPQFLRATYDIARNRARSLCRAYGGAYAAADPAEIINDPAVKLVFISSNHASHAEYAVSCIEAGKDVHIEKPHVVSESQLNLLIGAMVSHPERKVFLGFNRPRSRLFLQLRSALALETGPLMINWFVAGHEIPAGHWYFDEQEGGRVLGNLCHWTDLTLHLVTAARAFPCTIVSSTPAGSTSDFIVSLTFGDGSCAAITFSAKGHTFEGVREILNVHKGNVVANLTDFQRLSVEVVDKKRRVTLRHRDHGHGANIVHTLQALNDRSAGESAAYVSSTARLFLAIRQAIDGGHPIVLTA